MGTLDGQVSIFDLIELTDANSINRTLKRVRFKPNEVWKANFFKEFEVSKEYDVIEEYENRCNIKFYVLDGIERNAWSELFEEIK